MKKSIAITVIAILAAAAIALGVLYVTNNDSKTKEIAARDADIEAKAGEIETLNSDVAAKAEEIETLSADVSAKASEIEKLNTDVTNKSGQIDTLSADVKDKAEQIETLKKDVEEKMGLIETLTAEAADLTARINEADADNKAKAELIEGYKAELADKSAQIESLTSLVSDKNAQIDQLTAELKAKDEFSPFGYVISDTVNLRSEPSKASDGNIIRQLKKYALCVVIGSEEIDGDIWYKVTYDQKTGYIPGRYFKQMTIEEAEAFFASDHYREGIENNQPEADDARDHIKTEAPVTVMSHEEFVKAEMDSPVTIEAYVQANQSWWDGKIKLYLQDENHGGFFAYDLPCTEEEAAKLAVPGTKVRISGVKAEWSGEVEIIDATYEILEGSFIAEPEDVTALFGTDELINHMNEKIAVRDAKVVAKTIEGQEGEFAFLYAWDGSGSRESNSDLYFDVEIGGQVYTFTVESYLCGNDTDVYKAVEALKVGDTIDLEGFLYWYNGANPHITSVTEHKEGEAQGPVLLATVNGEEIWSDNNDLKIAMDYYIDKAKSYGLDTASEDVINVLQQYSMQYAQETAVIYQKAAELGLSATEEDKVQAEADAKAQWIDALDSYAVSAGLVTEDAPDEDKAAARADAAAQILEYYGYDEAKYVSEVAKSGVFTLIKTRLTSKVVGDKKVTDEEIRTYFEGLVEEDRKIYENDIATYEYNTKYNSKTFYYWPEGYRGIVHILLPVDEELMNNWKELSARLEEQASGTDETPAAEPVTQEMVDTAKQAILDSVKDKVAEINSKLEAGATFDDLIREYGTDPGMQNDARRAEGYPVHSDSIIYDPAFRNAAMALEKIGDVSEPVVGQNGVHILQYLRDIPGGAVELTDAMIEEFRGTLQSKMESDIMAAAVKEWINASEIVYTEAGESWKPAEEETK